MLYWISKTRPPLHIWSTRTDHFAPLFVALGVGEADLATQRTVIDDFWHGMAKRSIQLG